MFPVVVVVVVFKKREGGYVRLSWRPDMTFTVDWELTNLSVRLIRNYSACLLVVSSIVRDDYH